MVRQIRKLDIPCCQHHANIMPTSCQHHANIMPTVPKPEKECWKRPEETGAKTGHDGMMIMMQKRKRQSPRTANVPWLT
jgi:hypothetical protein